MAKFHGFIGYVDIVQTSPGVYEPVVEEKPCKGDILRDNRRWENTEAVNDDFTINNRFSVLADQEMYERYDKMVYLKWNGIKWKITASEVQRPRVIFNIKGVWNGN